MISTVQPTISVVIPTYNRSNVILRAINSVFNQTFQDFEIIVVDDGSVDDSKEVVLNIKDSRIIYVSQVNGGAAKARNTGISIAKGEYIAFLDSDDEFLPHHLANALPILKKDKNNCVYTQVICDRGNGIQFIRPPRAYQKDEDISEYYLCTRGFVQTSTLILPTFMANMVKYDELIGDGNDMEFSIRLVRAGGNLVMLPEPGAIWYDSGLPGRLSSRSDNLDHRLAWLERMRPMITDRAFYGELGWNIAKKYSQQGYTKEGLKLYIQAVMKRCYDTKLAISIFFQVVLSPQAYRQFSDLLARIGIRP